jgi:hypothetical protein
MGSLMLNNKSSHSILNAKPIKQDENNINTYVFILLIRNGDKKSIKKKDKADRWIRAATTIQTIEYILEHVVSPPMYKEHA